MADAPKLKDYFTTEVVHDIGERFRAVHPTFDVVAFASRVLDEAWADLTFTARSQAIADALWTTLDLRVEDALSVMLATLPEALEDPEGGLNEGFWMWPFGDLIATYAVDHPEPALRACEELTQRFTAEFAVRPLLAQHPGALDRVEAWAHHPSEHVRRLASEGTRPRLPWATRLDLPVDRVLAILSELRADPSLYVRRSVANHLNDLAKADSDRIVVLLASWHAEGVDETSWIVRHALRNHLKNGDLRVLGLFGYDAAAVDVAGLDVSPSAVPIGAAATITFELVERAGRPQKLMVDLVVGYVKANGTRSPKVFKFKDFELSAGATEVCRKKLDMVVRNTRALYPGKHTITLRVNGADLASASFELLP